jgi:hypothetical protein
MEMQPQAECYVWVGWQSAIAMLGMGDLKILVKKAFDRGFVDSHVSRIRPFRGRSQTRHRPPWRTTASG